MSRINFLSRFSARLDTIWKLSKVRAALFSISNPRSEIMIGDFLDLNTDDINVVECLFKVIPQINYRDCGQTVVAYVFKRFTKLVSSARFYSTLAKALSVSISGVSKTKARWNFFYLITFSIENLTHFQIDLSLLCSVQRDPLCTFSGTVSF